MLHDSPRYKPFTLTPPHEDRDNTPSTPGTPARFEVGLLVDGHTATMLVALRVRDGYTIGDTAYRSVDVSVTAIATVEDLAYQARPRVAWGFRSLTPVSFASARDKGPRRERSWPEPTRVLTNLAHRWDRFAGPVALPDAVWTVIEQHLETVGGQVQITDYLIEPSQHHRRAGYRHGSVGHASYRLAAPTKAPTTANSPWTRWPASGTAPPTAGDASASNPHPPPGAQAPPRPEGTPPDRSLRVRSSPRHAL